MRCVVLPSFYELDRERFFGESSDKRQCEGESDAERTNSGAPKARVLLADSHQPMRLAAADILSAACKAEVIGFASDGAQAIDDVFRLKPDILVLEVVLPVVDGIRVTRMLRNAKKLTKILILTGIVDGSFQRAAMEAGADAYVIKARMYRDLPLAVEAVLDGGTFCSPEKI